MSDTDQNNTSNTDDNQVGDIFNAFVPGAPTATED